MKCLECGGSVRTVRQPYRYKESGLDNVYLHEAELRVCEQCKEVELLLPRIDQLHGVIAKVIAEKSGALAGKEIRFLRTYLGFSQTDFAKAIGVHGKATVSRWENEGRPMGKMYDRFLRLMVFNEKPITFYPKDKFAELGEGGVKKVKVNVTGKNNEWTAELEAR